MHTINVHETKRYALRTDEPPLSVLITIFLRVVEDKSRFTTYDKEEKTKNKRYPRKTVAVRGSTLNFHVECISSIDFAQ
jgi:hypothetical protein